MAKQSVKEKQPSYYDLLEEIRSGKFRPYYVLMGEEPYYSDIISSQISDLALTPDEKGFNFHLFYGGDCSDRSVVEAARRYPMMASRQLVILREAQLLKQNEAFTAYFNQPMPSTILVIIYTQKSLDKRGTAYKAATSGPGVVFESQLMKDNQVISWLENNFKTNGYEIEPDASALMAEFCGPDLRKLALESSKLFAAVKDGVKIITASDVELNVGISREYNAFELGKALTDKKMERAYKIVLHFGTNPKQYPLVLTLGSLFYHFAKLLKYHSLPAGIKSNPGSVASAIGINPYFVRDYESAARNFPLKKTMEVISLIRRFDSMSKSNERGEANDNELLKELITRIAYSATTL